MSINAVFVKSTKEIIYSRHRHDCRSSSDKSVMVDGGFYYFKIVGNPDNYIPLKLEETVLLQQMLAYDYVYGNRFIKQEYIDGYHGKFIMQNSSSLDFFKKLIINFEDIREWL
jgi:hypothetical protein